MPALTHAILSGVTMRAAALQGVVKSLFEQKLLPRVLAGSSVGSIGEARSKH